MSYAPLLRTTLRGRRALLALTLIFVGAGRAAAQIAIMAPDADGGDAAQGEAKLPFKLPKAPTPVQDSFEDFKRFSKRAAWDKAFEALDKLRKAKATGFLTDESGFYLPIDVQVQKVVADLPAAGRDAFRLFYDAEAKALLTGAEGKQEEENLRRLTAAYLSTSVGDQAAYRYGDLCFEEGRFAEAAEHWKSILDHRPDSLIPRLRLLVKLAVASARAGRKTDFEAALQKVKDRYAGEKVVIGGKNVDAVEHLTALALVIPTSSATADVGDRPLAVAKDLVLPTTNQPAWQHRYYVQTPRPDPNQDPNEAQGDSHPLNIIPAVAADEQRVYVNHGLVQIALDLPTGKVAWRTARLSDVLKPDNQNNNRFNRFGVAAGPPAPPQLWFEGKELWSAASSSNNQGAASVRLANIDPATGKSLWNSSSVAAFNTWPINGSPIITPTRIFFCSGKQGGMGVFVACVRRSDGKVLWNTEVGSYNIDPNVMYYNYQMPQGRLLLVGERLYVDTHGGAIAELDAERGTLRWGYAYESESAPTPYYYYQAQTANLACGPLLYDDGVLYQKGMRSTRLYAFRPDGPSLDWKRPAAQASSLLTLDGKRLCLGGEDLSALGRGDRKLEWSTRVPTSGQPIPPLETPHQFAFFTPRGVFVFRKDSGDVVGVFRGADLESLGGRILATPQGLITVSNLAVTAYTAAPAAPAGK